MVKILEPNLNQACWKPNCQEPLNTEQAKKENICDLIAMIDDCSDNLFPLKK